MSTRSGQVQVALEFLSAGRGWTLVFRRPLAAATDSCVALAPRAPALVAFAVWDGSNHDRSAQKAVSPGLVALEIEG